MIKLIKTISELEYIEWVFWVNETKIYLDSYTEWKRDSTRKRKYYRKGKYIRLSKRDSSIKIEDINLSEEIKQEVLNEYISKITVEKWRN